MWLYLIDIAMDSNAASIEPPQEDGGKLTPPHKRHTYKKRNSNLVVGKVYADWCVHCHSLKPEWSKMKGILQKRKYGIQYVEIEELEIPTKFAEVKSKYGVEVSADNYPTLFKIEKGKLEYYNGERTAQQMADWYSPPRRREFKGGRNRSKRNRTTKTSLFARWFWK